MHSLCILHIYTSATVGLSIGAAAYHETAGIVEEVMSFIFYVGAPIILLTFLLPNVYVYMLLLQMNI